MKKLLAIAMAALMMLGAVACGGSKNKDFKAAADKVQTAAKNVCSASKATTAQEKEFKSNSFDSKGLMFASGAYYTCEMKDVKVSNLGSQVVKAGEMNGIFFFCKSEASTSSIISQIVGLKNEDLAKDYFEEIRTQLSGGMTGEDLENYGIPHGLDESEDEYALVCEMDGETYAYYIARENTAVVVICYEGTSDAAICGEFYDLMRETGYKDMEKLMEAE